MVKYKGRLHFVREMPGVGGRANAGVVRTLTVEQLLVFVAVQILVLVVQVLEREDRRVRSLQQIAPLEQHQRYAHDEADENHADEDAQVQR